jgi:formate dehydrogenase maturation protein FdhE
MKCSVCDDEHEAVYLESACHPGRPLQVLAVSHDEKEMTLEMTCAKCGKYVATFNAKRVYRN